MNGDGTGFLFCLLRKKCVIDRQRVQEKKTLEKLSNNCYMVFVEPLKKGTLERLSRHFDVGGNGTVPVSLTSCRGN